MLESGSFVSVGRLLVDVVCVKRGVVASVAVSSPCVKRKLVVESLGKVAAGTVTALMPPGPAIFVLTQRHCGVSVQSMSVGG